MSLANDITQLAKQDFLDRNRDLLALTKEGANGVFKRVAASMALDSETQDDCLMYLDLINQKGFAGQVAREDLQRELYKGICKAFIEVQHNFVIEFVSKLTPAAAAQLEDIEIVVGLLPPRAVVPPPAPPKSAAELLTEEVLTDWKRLPADKVKLKMNNSAYKAEFNRLMAADQLDSQCTTLTDNGAEFRS
jgi:hypothetical protein